MIHKLVFSKHSGSTFSRTQVLRTITYTFVFTVVTTLVATYYSMPVINEVNSFFANLNKTEYTSTAFAETVLKQQEDRLDILTAEEYQKRQASYKANARWHAIQKVQEELRTEQETIREKALLEMETGTSF